MTDARQLGFDTLAIHAGAEPDPATGARQVPIYQTTAYVFRDADHAAKLFNLQEVGYIYSRLTNPTVSALANRVVALEGGAGGIACSSLSELGAACDVVVSVEHGVNRLYLNDGTGKLRYVPDAFGRTMRDNARVRTADFNGDGHADMVFISESEEVHQLFLGDGKGGFTDASERLPAGSQGNGLAVGDVDCGTF